VLTTNFSDPHKGKITLFYNFFNLKLGKFVIATLTALIYGFPNGYWSILLVLTNDYSPVPLVLTNDYSPRFKL